jgi:DNA-directed RNA polymerase subunit H (RpoH/RPB5)
MSSLNSINMSKNEIIETVFGNLLLLLKRRNYIKNTNIDSKLLSELIENKVIYFEDNKKLSIYFFDNNIKNISTGSILDDYLNKKIDYHKFIISKNFNKKVYNQIKTLYKDSELFFIHELMEDIPSKIFIPEHQLLNEVEEKNILTIFKQNEFSKIYENDMMVRYYGGKVNNIFRIIRNNLSSGKSITYRIVIQGNNDILFN